MKLDIIQHIIKKLKIKEVFKMLKLSRKNLFDTGARVFRVGYCGAQNLLRGCYALGINRGLYGWNWEAYLLAPDVIINTGYRNMAGEDANKITSAYEKRAERIGTGYLG